MADAAGQTQIKPENIIRIIVRQRWLILIFVSISITMGLIKTLKSTRIYEATTMILVQPQKVPQSFVRSVVSTGIESRISTISQQIMSRSNLEKIINQFGLFSDKKGMYLEDKIMDLRSRIEVKISQARHGSEAFSIKYKGSNPQKVMKITNRLASYFMDENLKVREAQAVGTREFLDVELNKTRRKLELREKKLSDYRAKYMGGLPDELESNLRTLDRLQKQINSKQQLLRDFGNSLSEIKNQRAREKELLLTSMEQLDFLGTEEGHNDISMDEKGASDLREAIDSLLLKYTDKHPDVLKLKVRLKKLESKIEKNKQEKAKKPEEKEETDTNEISGHDFTKWQYESRIKELNKEIKRVSEDIKILEKMMEKYQKRVDETPKREQELQALNRDYKNIQAIYTSLLDRKLEAEISVNMEKKQKGEQFRILDQAKVPQKPVSPNVKKSFIMFLGLGFVSSGGICFLLLLTDNKIRSSEDIEKITELPILVEISPITGKKQIIKNRINLSLFTILLIYTTAMIGVFVLMNLQGIDRTINLLK